MTEFTKRDWAALELVWRLFCEVARRGEPALRTFLDAMREV